MSPITASLGGLSANSYGLFGVIASANSFESIQTVTVGAGGSATVSFTSIPSTYKHLQIRGLVQNQRATYPIDDMWININGDTANNYSNHILYGDGSTTGTYGTGNRGNIFGSGTNLETSTGGGFAANIIDILDYTNSNKYKTVRWFSGWDCNGTIAGYGGRVGLTSGAWLSTSTITSITFTPGNGNFSQYSSFALYGIKG